MLGWGIAVGGEVGNEALVGEDAGLGQAVHAFLDLDEYISIVYLVVQVVLLHDDVGYVLHRYSHIFEAIHRSIEVEVFDVGGEDARSGVGNDAVEKEFDCGEVGGGGGDFSFVIDAVAANSEANALFFGLVGAVAGDDLEIGGSASAGHFMRMDEVHGFGAGRHVRLDSFGESTDFICSGLDPLFGVFSNFEVAILECGAGFGVNDGVGGPESMWW